MAMSRQNAALGSLYVLILPQIQRQLFSGAGYSIARHINGKMVGQRVGTDMFAGIKKALLPLGALIATYGGASFVKNVIGSGIEYNALEQKSRAAFRVILGDGQKATDLMNELGEFASLSPFSKVDLIASTQKLLAFGYEAKDVTGLLSVFQDTVAGFGGSSQDIQEFADVFGRIKSQGRITGEELNRLSDRGVNAGQALAEYYGTSVIEVRKMIEKGQVDSEVAISAITGFMEKKFKGSAESVKQTWDGITQSIGARWRNVGSDLVEPFISKEGGGYAIGWLNTFADSISAFRKSDAFTELVQSADRFGAKINDRMNAFLKNLIPNIITGFRKVQRIFDELSPIWTNVTTFLGALKDDFVISFEHVFGKAPSISFFYDNLVKFSSWINDVINKEVAPIIGAGKTGGYDLNTQEGRQDMFKDFFTWWVKTWPQVKDFFSGVAQVLAKFGKEFFNALLEVIPMLASLLITVVFPALKEMLSFAKSMDPELLKNIFKGLILINLAAPGISLVFGLISGAIKGIIGLGKGLGAAGGAIGAGFGFLRSIPTLLLFNRIMKTAFGTGGTLGKAGGVVSRFVAAWGKFVSTPFSFSKVFSPVTTFFSKLKGFPLLARVNGILGALSVTFPKLYKSVSGVFGGIKGIISSISLSVGQLKGFGLKGLFNMGALSKPLGVLGGIFSKLFLPVTLISGVFHGLFSNFATGKSMLDTFSGAVELFIKGDWLGGLGQLGEGILSFFANLVLGIVQDFLNIINFFAPELGLSMGKVMEEYNNFWSDAWDNFYTDIGPGIEKWWVDMGREWHNFWNDLFGGFDEFATGFSQGWNDFWGGIGQWAFGNRDSKYSDITKGKGYARGGTFMPSPGGTYFDVDKRAGEMGRPETLVDTQTLRSNNNDIKKLAQHILDNGSGQVIIQNEITLNGSKLTERQQMDAVIAEMERRNRR